jgi:hypothetical protein
MSRSSKIRIQRLSELEAEFEPLLFACLRDCEKGRYGLFGQNDHIDPEHKWWKWPAAQRVLELANEIQELSAEFGQTNIACTRFLHYRALRGSNVSGEPKLAKKLLQELETE